jgi:hypothetical protein
VAQRPVVQISCDTPPTKKAHKGEPRPFEYTDPETGERRVVDLCDAHGAPVRSAVAKVAPHSRPAAQQASLPSPNGRAGPRGHSGSKAGTRVDSTEVREWAKSVGIEVKDRGRVPATLVARFRAAH